MSFANLKKNSAAHFEELSNKINDMNKSKSYDNDESDYWKLTVDKAQNGLAIIRFLPAPDGEDFPFVRMWDHGFQGDNGQWYIENSLTTLGKDDPVSEYNSTLWKTGLESDKEIARKQKRRLGYHSNIYVVKDAKNPENEGKVFKFKYGKQIFDMINDAMYPPVDDNGDQLDPDQAAINPFDLWEGANFKLISHDKDGWRSYTKSTFLKTGPLVGNDDEMEEIWNSEYSLQEIISEKNFKSYDELKTRMNLVLGLTPSSTTPNREQTAEKPEPEMKSEEPVDNTPPFDTDTDGDDDISFFRELAEKD